MNNTILRIAASIDPGQERDYQEDNYSIGADLEAGDWKLPGSDIAPGSKGTLLVVADGMGGLNAGEVASKIVVESIQAYFDPSRLSSATANPGKVLVEGILYANGEILKHAKKNPDTEGMGTTVVLAWILDGALHVAWSGDSRCYLLRQGQRIYQVNHDHSYVQELIDQKQITSEEAFYHPNKNIITQSLGDVGRQPSPGYETTPLQAGDRILLCSDGLNTMLHDAEIESFLGAGSVSDAARSLVQAANDAGGYDNITAVVAEVVDSAVAITGAPAYVPVATPPAAQPMRPEAPKSEAVKTKGFWSESPSWAKALLILLPILGVATALFVISLNKSPEPDKKETTTPGTTTPPPKAEPHTDPRPIVTTTPPPGKPQPVKPATTDPSKGDKAISELKKNEFNGWLEKVKGILEDSKTGLPNDGSKVKINGLLASIASMSDYASVCEKICTDIKSLSQTVKIRIFNNIKNIDSDPQKKCSCDFDLGSAPTPKLEPIGPPNEIEYGVQIGCFDTKAEADDAKLKATKTEPRFPDAEVIKKEVEGSPCYAVIVKRYKSRESAKAASNGLEKQKKFSKEFPRCCFVAELN